MLGEEKVKNFLPFGERAVASLFLSWSILSSVVFFVFAIILFFTHIDIVFLIVLGGLYLLFLAVIYLYCTAYLNTFLFELRDGYFFVRRGVITPGYTMIPYENLQDVHLDQPVLEKALGLCNVRVYTATFSAKGSESVPGLTPADAQILKESLFKKIGGGKEVVD